jgi:hypothetical protein
MSTSTNRSLKPNCTIGKKVVLQDTAGTITSSLLERGLSEEYFIAPIAKRFAELPELDITENFDPNMSAN